MSLSNAIKTWLVDPRSHNNKRTEFRLEDAFWASNMKLIDLGMYDAQQTGTIGEYYPTINGVLQTIENIYLYSGTTLLDSIQNVQQYSSIEALKTSNQGSNDLNRQLLLNGMGFGIANDAENRPGALSLEKRYDVDYNTVNGAAAKNNQVPIPAGEDEQSGAAQLSRYLKFLESTSVLPMIPDLKLVIEWNTSGNDYFLDPAHAGALTNVVPVPLRPTLICDEILGMNPMDARAFNIPYLSTIVERFPVDATTTPANDSVPKRSSFKSQAFTQKFLKDLTFFNYPSSSLAAANQWLARKTRSPAQKDEKIQVVVNNETLIPDQGIDSPALKYHYFNDTQTQLNLPYAAGVHGLVDGSGNVLDDATAPLIGQFSVTSVKVGKIISDLRIEHQRLYGSSASSREAFTLLAFGTVAKNLEVKDGRARVSY